MNKLSDCDFVSMQLPIEMTNKVEIQRIESKLYERNLQITCKKHLTAYHQVDLAILWFINIISCRQQLTFT